MIKNNDFNEINTLKVLNEIRLICGNINKMGSLRKRIAMNLILSNLLNKIINMRFYHNFIIIYRKIQKMSIVLGGQFLFY